jgi:cyclic pyranopterin phosphate synthase
MKFANDRLRLILTSKCNLDCFYCHNEGQAKGSAFFPSDLFDIVVDSLENSGVQEVTLSGGEPLLHPNTVDMVARLRAAGPRVTVVSNGLLLDRALAQQLSDAGLSKFRLGIDSLRPRKPRPSKGYLTEDANLVDKLDMLLSLGISADLNVVLTKFNQSEIAPLTSLALARELSIKFFEHVEVGQYGGSGHGGLMFARPQVPEDVFRAELSQVLDRPMELLPTDDFGMANLAVSIDKTEIRYCKYLCPFGLCWVTGTRIDAEAFVYTCMSNRGLENLGPSFTRDDLQTSAADALASPCRVAVSTT